MYIGDVRKENSFENHNPGLLNINKHNQIVLVKAVSQFFTRHYNYEGSANQSTHIILCKII